VIPLRFRFPARRAAPDETAGVAPIARRDAEIATCIELPGSDTSRRQRIDLGVSAASVAAFGDVGTT